MTRSGFIEVFGGCPALRLNSVTDFTNPQVIDGTEGIRLAMGTGLLAVLPGSIFFAQKRVTTGKKENNKTNIDNLRGA